MAANDSTPAPLVVRTTTRAPRGPLTSPRAREPRAPEHARGIDSAIRSIVRDVVREELASHAVPRPDADPYLSTAAAAKLVDVAEGTIRRWVREGRLPGHRAGRVLRVRASELRQLLATGVRAPKRDDLLSPEALARRDFALGGR